MPLPLIFLFSGKRLPFVCRVEVRRLRKLGDVSWIQSLFYSCWVLASLPDTASASGALVSAAVDMQSVTKSMACSVAESKRRKAIPAFAPTPAA